MDIATRMKMYEKEQETYLNTYKPTIARIDGRSFHTFCKGLHKPFDVNLIVLMITTTEFLVREFQPVVGYTQSDEITLVWKTSPTMFSGRVQKLVSVLASACTSYFAMNREFLPSRQRSLYPTFDCRIFNVPDLEEAANNLRWRQEDAIKNSISATAHAYFDHKVVLGKDSQQQLEMLRNIGVEWDSFPVGYKRGYYVAKREVTRTFTPEEIDLLPRKHAARRNPNLQYTRSEVGELDLPLDFDVKEFFNDID